MDSSGPERAVYHDGLHLSERDCPPQDTKYLASIPVVTKEDGPGAQFFPNKSCRNPFGLSPLLFGLLVGTITTVVVGGILGGALGSRLARRMSRLAH